MDFPELLAEQAKRSALGGAFFQFLLRAALAHEQHNAKDVEAAAIATCKSFAAESAACAPRYSLGAIASYVNNWCWPPGWITWRKFVPSMYPMMDRIALRTSTLLAHTAAVSGLVCQSHGHLKTRTDCVSIAVMIQ